MQTQQTHKSQQFRNVLQNPVDPGPIFTWLLRAAHSWFNQVKSLFGVKKVYPGLHSLHRLAPQDQDVSTDKDTSEIQLFLCTRSVIQDLLHLENPSDSDLNLLAKAF